MSSSGDRAVELLLRFARAGHEAGYPTADLEERVLALAETLGLDDAQVSATPTLVDVSFGAVGMAGGVAGRLLNRSPLVFVVPGVLMLVPGSAGFASALHLLSDQTVTGIAAAFDTFVTAMSIAYGLLVSAVILPRRVPGAGHAQAEATP